MQTSPCRDSPAVWETFGAFDLYSIHSFECPRRGSCLACCVRYICASGSFNNCGNRIPLGSCFGPGGVDSSVAYRITRNISWFMTPGRVQTPSDASTERSRRYSSKSNSGCVCFPCDGEKLFGIRSRGCVILCVIYRYIVWLSELTGSTISSSDANTTSTNTQTVSPNEAIYHVFHHQKHNCSTSYQVPGMCERSPKSVSRRSNEGFAARKYR